MRYVSFVLSALFFCQGITAQPHTTVPRPKLVIGIVIDQMRWDYLYRYYDRYTNDGFKRLMNNGYNCQNTIINYLPTYTAPGHASIYTGSVPSIHGIAANDWIDNLTGNNMYCVGDVCVRLVDNKEQPSMSPRNMLVTTITDELRLATNLKSKVYSVAIKDRGSILPGGHMANGAYWYNDATGNFTTSTYYANSLPVWLTKFNSRNLADSLTQNNWELLYPASTYTQSTADDNAYEQTYKNEQTPVFPHRVNNFSVSERYKMIKSLPAGNTLTFEIAKACINGEKLGQTGNTDFMCVSFSSTDYIGHQFGPNAVEAEDMYLRFDKELGTFLNYLDSKVGKGNYILFLSADHGAAHNTSFMKDSHIPAGAVSFTTAKKLNAYLKDVLHKDSLVTAFNNYQVFLNESLVKSSGIKREKIKTTIREWFYKDTAVTYAIDMEDMSKTPVPEPIHTMIVNGYNRQYSGCIQVIYNAAWYETGMKGTTHGSWNPYDSHIPLLWYGWHIPKGETYQNIAITDIAPTLAALLHIQMPNGCVGKVIPLPAKGE